jgi:hypothetical protein
MTEFFVWVTTRRIKEGALEDLRWAWEPPEPPEGMTRAFEWVGADGRTVVGVSHWESEESCERYRSSAAGQSGASAWRPTWSRRSPRRIRAASSRFPAASASVRG